MKGVAMSRKNIVLIVVFVIVSVIISIVTVKQNQNQNQSQSLKSDTVGEASNGSIDKFSLDTRSYVIGHQHMQEIIDTSPIPFDELEAHAENFHELFAEGFKQGILQGVAYGLGVDAGMRMTLEQASESQMDEKLSIAQGVADAIMLAELAVTEDEYGAVVRELEREREQLEQAEAEYERQLEVENQTMLETNLKAAEDFLAENAKKEGVITLESGMQIKHLIQGNGIQPEARSTVKVHYEGTHLDGTVFDSSIQRGEPIEFPLTGVIPGFSFGIQEMSVGGTAMLYIPSSLGYGDQANPGSPIGPGELLTFKVELIEFR